jgi:hypothetical protein
MKILFVPCAPTPVALTGIIIGGRVGPIPKELDAKVANREIQLLGSLAVIRRSNSLLASAEQNWCTGGIEKTNVSKDFKASERCTQKRELTIYFAITIFSVI